MVQVPTIESIILPSHAMLKIVFNVGDKFIKGAAEVCNSSSGFLERLLLQRLADAMADELANPKA